MGNLRIIDISLPLSPSLLVWPGDEQVAIAHTAHLERGDAATVSRLNLGAHAGTHVDAPAHFIRGGATVDQLALDVLVGPALVVAALGVSELSVATLEELAIPPGVERLLFQTDNGRLWERSEFAEEFVGLTEDGARWLVARGVRLVGVDYLSVATLEGIDDTHRVLLGVGVVLLESIDLRGVAPGWYRLVCLPLRVVGAEGAPTRAILIEEAADEPEPMKGA